MQSDDLAHCRRDALQILTIATLVFGFALFENPFVSGNPVDYSSLPGAMKLIAVLYVVMFYLLTVANAGVPFLAKSLAGRALQRAR